MSYATVVLVALADNDVSLSAEWCNAAGRDTISNRVLT